MTSIVTKTGLIRLTASLSVVALLAGCGLSESGLRAGTANELGRMTSDQVRVSDIDRGAIKTRWTARTPRGRYRCEADHAMVNVVCVR